MNTPTPALAPVRNGACRSHPTYPHIILDADGGVYDSRKGRYLTPADNGKGYKRVSIAGTSHYVHRLQLEAWYGPNVFSGGLETRHRIPNRDDNRIFNLRVGTRVENIQDALDRDRNWNQRKTHCPRGHELTAPNLTPSGLRQGNRQCLACNRARGYIGSQRRSTGVDLSPSMQDISDSYYDTLMREHDVEAYGSNTAELIWDSVAA